MEDLRSDALLAKTTEVKGYKILPPCVLYARIGSGGMGAVYRGHHLNLDIEVAIKCLKPSLVADDPTFVERFKREGRSAAKINHQNVIRVFDVAENLGLHYLIMEFVSGETARQRVERKGALDVSEALQIVYESSLGLGEAHRMGIIHRDVKPDNLLISSRGQVKVADLGLAKPAVSSGQSMLSMAGQVMGTPPYMPPEQWGEGTVTAASDVWAMGAVLYYLLTAREAMGGESLAAIMSKIVLQEFPDVRTLNPTVPDEVVAVLQKATAKAPGDRYLDAYALADAIAQLPQHRISLADTDAGTTELRTMLSPPPNVRFDEIKELLRTKASTVGASARDAEPAVVDDTGGGRFPWVAVLLVLLLVGGGGAGYVYRDQLFGKDPDQPNALAVAEGLARDGRSVAALKAARDVLAAGAATMDAKLLGTLREDAADQLQAVLTRAAPAAGEAVEKGAEVRFAGRLVGVQIDELLVGGVAATFTGEDFVASVVVPASGEVTIQARVTAEDTIDLESWSVAFKEEVAIKPTAQPDKPQPDTPKPDTPKPGPLPVAFDGGLTTEPKLGERNTVGELSITVIGRASERDLELRLQGKAINEEKVTWQADGSFRAEVDLPNEGANTIALTVARSGEPAQALRAEQTRSLEVIRLTRPPTIGLVSPATEVSATTATEVLLEVTSGEWTESVSARAGAQVVEFQKGATKEGKTTWRAQRPLELDDNKNSVTITARNLTRKEREQPLTITCEAKPLEITAINLAVAGADVAVKPGATVFVNKQPEVKISVSDAKAKVFLGGKPGVKRFPANLVAGQRQKYSVRAEKGLRQSQLWTFTVVYDTKGPGVSCDKVAPVPPGTEVTLRGTYTDDFGIGSVGLDVGGKAKLTGADPKSGRWSVRVRVGDASSTFTVIALDLAGNRSSVAVPVTVVKPESAKPVVLAPEKPTPKPTPKPVVKLSAKINPALFAPVGKLNQMGFPPELRHKTTGITLLAVNFVDTMDPSYYVAKRVVTNQQWNGDTGSGTGPKVSVRWMDVARKVNSERFEGLAMVTKQQWQMVRNGKVPGIVLDEKAEWLAQDAGDSRTMRAIGNRADVKMVKYTDSNGFIGFRVGFKP